MAESRLIQKQLAGKEDLLLGVGKVSQARATGVKTITKLNATHFGGVLVVDTINDLNSLDKNQLDEQVVLVKGDGNTYIYNGTSWVTQTAIVTVDTLADLKNISYPSVTVWASGYHTKNDGAFGSHIFRLKGVKTTETDNSGTVIIATIGGTDYVYELQFDGAVNVKWFGAKGDYSVNGVVNPNPTDDTAAIQNIFNVMPNNTVVYFPDSRYYITSTITISRGFTVLGDGRVKTFPSNTGSILFCSDTFTGNVLELTGSAPTLDGINIGGNDNNTSGDGIVILSNRVRVKNCGVFKVGNDGIRVGRDSPGNFNLWSIQDCIIYYSGNHGVHVSQDVSPSLPDTNIGDLRNSDIAYARNDGIFFNYTGGNTIDNVTVQFSGRYGVHLTSNCDGIKMIGGDYEVNGRPEGIGATSYYDLYIENGSEYNTIVGVSTYNFPQTVLIESDTTTILNLNDNTRTTGTNQYNGLCLPNIESDNTRVLDWYEEGDFTPIIIGETSAGVGDYAYQVGKFTRIGNVVNFSIYLQTNSHTGTGNMSIRGLPYASSSGYFSPVTITSANISKPADSYLTAMQVGGEARIKLYSVSSASIAATNTPLAIDTNGSVLYMSGTYFV